MNWCGCTNHFLTASTGMAAPVLCDIERATIAAARRVVLTLVQADNEMFDDHLTRYQAEWPVSRFPSRSMGAPGPAPTRRTGSCFYRGATSRQFWCGTSPN